MPAPTIPPPLDAPSCPFCREPLTDALDALLLALREAIAPALAAAERIAAEDAAVAELFGDDDLPDYGGNCDDAFAAGHEAGRAAMAADVAALIEAAARPGAEDGEEVGHG